MDEATAVAIVNGELPCDDKEVRIIAEQVFMRLFYGELQ